MYVLLYYICTYIITPLYKILARTYNGCKDVQPLCFSAVFRFSCELRVFHEAKSQQTSTLSKAIMCIEDAEAELVSLERTLGQEMEQLEEKKYVSLFIPTLFPFALFFATVFVTSHGIVHFPRQACVKLLGQTGQDTAIAAEHEKFLLRLKERINHLEKVHTNVQNHVF